MSKDTSHYPDEVYVAYDEDFSAQTYDIAASLEAGTLVGTPVKYIRYDIARCDELETVARLGGLNGVTLVRHLENMRPEYVKKNYKGELVTRQNSEEVIAAKDARIAELEEHFAEMTRSCLAERDRNKTLEADNKRLREEIAAERLKLEATAKVGLQLSERVEALEADNKRLREALEPFAKTALVYDDPDENGPWPDIQDVFVTLGDCRRARAALGEVKP